MPVLVVSIPSSQSTAAVPTPRPKLRRPLRRLAVLLFAVVASLALGELALRIWVACCNPPIYELDERLGWRHTRGIDRQLELPGSQGHSVRFQTDARGLRATPHVAARTPGVRRVLVAGDSFTQGSQVEAEDLFTVRLERALPQTEVWNAGVGGYSTLQQLRALPEQLAAFAPDLVVLVVYDNDFQDNLMPYYSFLGPRPYVRVRGDEVEVVEQPDVASFERFLMPAPCALWCYEHCALYRALHKTVFWRARGMELVGLETREREALPPDAMRTAMTWLLRRTAATVGAGRTLLVAAIPTREDARAGASATVGWLEQCCTGIGVPFVSLLPALHAAGGDDAYFAADIHLTARGHAVVAAALQAPVLAALPR